MKKLTGFIVITALLLLSGCAASNSNGADVASKEADTGSYKQITTAEAMKMMEEQSDYIIVDVRTPEEYAEGHIPNAVNVPNETLSGEKPEALPNSDQTLFVYCRSGNRSKQASQKLVDMGYTNVCDFGGIKDWTSEIETSTD